MAEGPSVTQGNPEMRYCLSLNPFEGFNFFQDATSSFTPVRRYFMRGECVDGDNCQFDHVGVSRRSRSLLLMHTEKYSATVLRRSSIRRVPYDVDAQRRNAASGASSSSADSMNVPDLVSDSTGDGVPEKMPSAELCQNYINADCLLVKQCPYVRGDICQLCFKACLHPTDEEHRNNHIEQCRKEHHENIKYFLAVQNSRDKTCNICYDVVLEKQNSSERKFGILEKCNHVYCLKCIKTWRKMEHEDLEPVTTNSCPTCRIESDFVIPSRYVVDTEEEKNKLIADYRQVLSQKDCKYFKRGRGVCPYGAECFNLHAMPPGKKIQFVIPPWCSNHFRNLNRRLTIRNRIRVRNFIQVDNS